MVGLHVHGVQYERKDGSKVTGTFLPLLLENLADAIVTGREEVGMPKLYSEISVSGDDGSKRLVCSWRGTTFIDIKVGGLRGATISVNGHQETSPKENTSDKLLFYRYIPAVGEPGVADAEYAVELDPAAATTPPVVEKTLEGDAASSWARCTAGDDESLPTLHHIASGLAEIPVYQVLDVSVHEGVGVDSLAHARRID